MEMVEGSGETPREKLPPISAMDKIIVAFAGPLFSFGLACFFAVIVWGIGYPVDEATQTTTIGRIAQNTYSLDLLEGDADFPDQKASHVALKRAENGDLLIRLFDLEGKKQEVNSADLQGREAQLDALNVQLEPYWGQAYISDLNQAKLAASVASLVGHEIKKLPGENSDLRGWRQGARDRWAAWFRSFTEWSTASSGRSCRAKTM